MHYFEHETFSAAEFINSKFQSLSERELDVARHELTALDEFCRQEARIIMGYNHACLFCACHRSLFVLYPSAFHETVQLLRGLL